MKKPVSLLGLIFLFVFPVILSACGQSGPLYLPDQLPTKKKKSFYEHSLSDTEQGDDELL